MSTDEDARGSAAMTSVLEPPDEPSSEHPSPLPSPPASPFEAVSETGPVALIVTDDVFSDDTIDRAFTRSAPHFPVPPERGSLEDEVLVPLVDRHSTDTATIDLIGILQAQMKLRQTEAARFAAWEHRMRSIGTEAAYDEIERTRLHFTGVIPVQTGVPLVTGQTAVVSAPPVRPVPAAPTAPSEEETARDAAEPAEAGADVIHVGTAPTSTPNPAGSSGARTPTADEDLLESGLGDEVDPTDVGTDGRGAAPITGTAGRPGIRAGVATRILVSSVSFVAALAVVFALVVVPLGVGSSARAAAAAVGVVAAAWLGVALARLALGRGQLAAATGRTVVAAVLGLVFGTAVGEGLVQTSSWQGYLVRAVELQGLGVEQSIAVGAVAAAVVAFVLATAIDRVAPRPSDAA